MTSTSNQLSVRSDRPLDGWTRAILAALDRILQKLDCPYMLVGATARDILLVHVFGMSVVRATRDLDFAIAVPSWKRFAAVREAILHANGFAEDLKTAHRLLYRSSGSEYPVPVDIIPFGGVADSEGRIAWPPDASFVMNVSGFEEALGASVRVRIDEELMIPVVSLAGLAILKLFAWNDRRSDKDATDFFRILTKYADAGNEDRLYGQALDILERQEFNIERAGAVLLGQDAAAIATDSIRAHIRELFFGASLSERFAAQMLGERAHLGQSSAESDLLLDLFLAALTLAG